MRPAALALLVAAAPGCGVLTLGRGGGGSALDAHVVYQQRAGCPTLLARTLDHGYTVMTPEGGPFALTGVFEGPAREGESVFRYTPPNVTPVWPGDPAEVRVDVQATGLELPAARGLWASVCGVPEGADEPSDPDVNRLPLP